MFENKKITKDKVKKLLDSVYEEYSNDLEYDYESDDGRELTDYDFYMARDFICGYLDKVYNTIDDELED